MALKNEFKKSSKRFDETGSLVGELREHWMKMHQKLFLRPHKICFCLEFSISQTLHFAILPLSLIGDRITDHYAVVLILLGITHGASKSEDRESNY